MHCQKRQQVLRDVSLGCGCRCHNYDLDSPLDRETGLDIFKVDPEYEQHEAEYQVRGAPHHLCVLVVMLSLAQQAPCLLATPANSVILVFGEPHALSAGHQQRDFGQR